MGVPSFYRWLIERYPLTVEKLHGGCGQEGDASHAGAGPIDNLYLDLNGVIHPCFHPEGKPPPASEEEVRGCPAPRARRRLAGSPFPARPPTARGRPQVLLAILEYIDALLALVRPTNLLYLAVDGPAPRAKMNQQRSRRFKSAAEAQEKERIRAEIEAEWRAAGKEPPGGFPGGAGGGAGGSGSDALADSNVITPGTPFMATLGRWLRYYSYARLNGERPSRPHGMGGADVVDGGEGANGSGECGPGELLPTGEIEVRSEDGLRIILSDASVPGEGEHKICHYVRVQRQAAAEAAAAGGKPRALHHAIHGLDADLIMLALATREPRFSIVREVQSRGRRRRGPAFELLRVHVLREYLTRELGTGCDWSGN
eukprot:scaffold10403_cov101-Isochrysis_galbana.AAC.1